MAEQSAAQDHKGASLNDAADRMRGIFADDPLGAPAPEQEQPAAEAAQTESESSEEPQGEALDQEPEAEQAEELNAEADEAEADDEATEQEGAEPGAESLELGADEFAEMLGLDESRINVNDDGVVTFRVKGEEGETDVNLDSLINAYQGDVNLTNRSKQIAELEKARTAELEAVQESINDFAQKAAIQLEAINNAYVTDFQQVDWAGLKAEDPAAWSAKMVEFQQRKAQIDGLVQNTLSQIQQQQEQAKAEEAKTLQARLASESQATVESFKQLGIKPGKDLERVGDDVQSYLAQSFDESELSNLLDHRYMTMAYKAMMFDKGLKGATSKKVKKVPKVLKSGSKPSTQQVKINEGKKVRAQHKKQGTVDSAADALKGLL